MGKLRAVGYCARIETRALNLCATWIPTPCATGRHRGHFGVYFIRGLENKNLHQDSWCQNWPWKVRKAPCMLKHWNQVLLRNQLDRTEIIKWAVLILEQVIGAQVWFGVYSRLSPWRRTQLPEGLQRKVWRRSAACCNIPLAKFCYFALLFGAAAFWPCGPSHLGVLQGQWCWNSVALSAWGPRRKE